MGKRSKIKLTFSWLIAFVLIFSPLVSAFMTIAAAETSGDFEVSVSYDANGGSGEMKTLTVARMEYITLPENGFIAPEGCTFKTWDIGGTEYAPNEEVQIRSDTVVKAIWKDVSEVSEESDVGPSAETEPAGLTEVKDSLLEVGSETLDASWPDPPAEKVMLFATTSSRANTSYITVVKTFKDLPENKIPANFQVTVSSDTNSYTLNKDNYGWEQAGSYPEITWSWRISGAGLGTYYVTEQNEEVENYTVTTAGEGNITVSPEKFDINQNFYATTCNTLDWQVGINGDTNTIFAASLTKARGSVVISYNALSASQQAVIQEKILAYRGPWKIPVYFFSIEQQGTSFNVEGATIIYHESGYNPDGGSYIHIGSESDWQHLATLSYSITKASNPEIELTNTYTPNETSRTVSKVWNDNNNQDGLRTDVTLKLVATATGAEVSWADLKATVPNSDLMDDDGMVTLTGKINESYSFTNLPVKYQGHDIVYTVHETPVPSGYEASYDQNTLTVTNTHTPEVVDVSGTKTWEDNNDQDGMRPASITIRLLKNGTEIASKIVTEADGWAWSFTDLPKYEAGELITYTITEDTVSGYSSAVSGYNVTNTQVEAGLVITKKWLDNGQAIENLNTSTFSPIKVNLKRRVGTSVDSSFNQVIELTYNTDANLSWRATVNKLPIKDSTGTNYTYFIEEDVSTIPDKFYIKEYLNQGIQLQYQTNLNPLGVTNERKQSQLVIQKLWFKSDGTTQLANLNLPSSLKVKLFRTTDGTTSGGELYKEITLSRQQSSGTYVWKTTETVPIRDKSGTAYYTYYIEEEKLVGYLEISNASEKFVRFTNSNTPSTATLTLKNKVNPIYPATGGFGNIPYLMVGMLSIFMAIIIQFLQKKRKVFGEENMKKFTQILFTLLTALCLIVSSLGSVVAFAEQANAPAADEKYDIVLTKVKLTDLTGWPKQTGADNTTYTGQKLTVTDYFGAGAETLANVWFEVHQGSATGDIVAEGLTGADGTITFTGLSAGKYYIVENKAKSKLSSSEQLANSAAVPVEIELPVFKAEGGWYTTGADAVHVYPKNTVDKPDVKKVVNEADMHDTTLIGESKTFKITSTMPEGIKDYQVLTFNDTFSKGLSYNGGFTPTLTRAGVETAIPATAYTFVEPAVGTKAATLSIVFKQEFIATLQPKDVITIKYDAYINEDAIMGAANPNGISLTYGTNPSETKTVEPTTPPNEETPNPELHTGGKKFTKQDKVSQAGLSGAQFVVKNSDGKFLKQTTNTDGKVTKTEWVASQTDGTVFTSQADGTFEVVGLPYGTANQKASEGSTDYQLVEIKAPEGYALLQQLITFTVNATSYYQDPTAVDLVAADPQKVDNNKVTIPQTGGIGSVVVIVAGVLVAGFGLMLKRRLAK
ncbi:TPA: SpaH/EbpB family LPXTG-anchored major pilin [Streptococcus suis]